MNQELGTTNERRKPYYNDTFERSYGDVLTEIIKIMHPTTKESNIENEKDIFYFKLRILESLTDATITVGAPSEHIERAFDTGLQAGEFDDFRQQAEFILEVDPTSSQVLTDDVLKNCNAVISNPNLVSLYFTFQVSKPRNLN